MKRIILTIVYIISIHHFLHAQQIKGVVIDSVSRQPIPFVSIGVIGSSTGTISNEQGNFILRLQKNNLSDIGFSAIGYNIKKIKLNTIIDTFIEVKLSRNSINLKEVFVLPDMANYLLDNMLKKYLNDTLKNEINVNSYLRLYSSSKSTTYENLEAVYSASTSIRKIQKLQIENGRYGLIDSFKQNNLVLSYDFSKLVTHLNLFNYETQQNVNYPWFPLFIKKRKKFVKVKLVGYENSQNGVAAQISIVPNNLYDDKFFTTQVWINTKTYDIEKITAEIQSPIESPVHLMDQSKLDLQKIKLIILFDSFGDSLYTYPKYNSVKLNYLVLKNETIPVETFVQFINYEKNNTNQPIAKQEYDSDYGLIQSTLYLKNWWGKNVILEKTKQEYELNETFNKLNYFDNCFDTKKDTDNFLVKGISICDFRNKNNFQLSKLSDSATILTNDSFVLTQGGKAVAGLYFNIYFLSACSDGQLKYVCLPLFDIWASWANADVKTSLELETLMRLMCKLTFIYSKKLEEEINEIDEPCLHRNEVEKIKQGYLLAYDRLEKQMVNDVWKNGKFIIWEKRLSNELGINSTE